MRRSLPLSAVAVASAFALPAAAHATTICVAKPACAATPGTASSASLKAAVDAAAASAGPDRIELGAGTFPYAGLPVVSSNNELTEIVGAGQGATHLTPGPAGEGALEVDRAGTVVSDLTVDAPGGTTGSLVTLGGGGATIRRVTVAGAAVGVRAFAVTGPAALDQVTTTLATGPGGPTSLYSVAGGVTITGSSFTSTFGIRHYATGPMTLRGVALHTRFSGLEIDEGSVDADGLLVDVLPGGGEAVTVASPFTSAQLTLRHATIVKSAGEVGIHVQHYTNPGTSSVLARDVLIAGAGGTDIWREATAGTATLDIADSSYAPAHVTGIAGLPGPTDVVTGDPGLVAAAAGDYRLRSDSPLIDRGEPVLPAGGVATDLAGSGRVLDGDGDGVARTDIGAYEFAPPVVAGAGAPGAPQGGPGSATGPAAAPVVAAGRLTLTAGRQRLDRHGRVSIAARCAAAGGCRGTVRLTARIGGRTVVLGGAKVGLAAGRHATLHVRVAKAGRRALRRHGHLTMTVRATVRDGAGTLLPAAAVFVARRR